MNREVDLSKLNDEQLAIAKTLDRPLFVEAGAGSGKTSTLTKRIAWALSPDSGEDGAPFLSSLDEVLVITFTDAAAREIKERVRAELRRAGMRDAALQVDDAWISTIHGMCSRILHRHALDLELDPDFRMCAGSAADMARSQAIEGAFAWAHGGKQWGRFSPLFDTYDAYGDGSRTISSMVSQVIQQVKTIPGEWDSIRQASFGDIRSEIRRMKRLHEESLILKHDKRSYAVLEANSRVLDGFDVDAASHSEIGEVASKLRKVPMYSRVAESKASLADINQCLTEIRFLLVQPLYPLLIELAKVALALEMRIKRDNSMLDNDDLVWLARKAVTENETVARDYAGKFKLVMIDEFQDTDAGQLELIGMLAANDGGSIATVGDAQQSIYAFRGADVRVFRAYGKTVDEAGRLKLGINYRSHKDVLDFVDYICGQRGLVNDFMHLDHNPSRTDKYSAKGYPRIHLEVCSNRGSGGSDHRSATLASQIADKMAQFVVAGARPKDMVLLLGATTKSAFYLDALRSRGIECVVTGGSTFSSSPEAITIQALLHTLANSKDTNSGLYRLLSSDMFCLDANDFIALGTRGQEALDAPTSRKIGIGLDSMDFYGGLGVSRRAEHARDVILRARERLSSMPVPNVCLLAVRESGWLSRLEAQGAQGVARAANVLAAIEYVRDLTVDLGLGVVRASLEFDRWMEVAKEPPASLTGDSLGAMEVMTIHRSKGLQFPIVAVAECWKRVDKEKTGFLARADSDEIGAKKSAILLPPGDFCLLEEDEPGKPSSYLEFASETCNEMVSLGIEEKARLLYVALTRAQEALVLGLSFEIGSKGVSGNYPQKVVDAIFGDELPEPGLTSLDYGGAESAPLRYICLEATGDKEDKVITANSAGSLAGFDGQLPDAAEEVVTLGLELDSGSDGRIFDFYAEEEPDIPDASLWRQREGVFSYSSAHQLMSELASEGDEAPVKDEVRSKASSERRYQREVIDDAGPDFADADKATDLGSAFHELAQVMVETGKEPSQKRIDVIANRWSLSSRNRIRLENALALWAGSDLRAEAIREWSSLRAEVPFFARVKSRFGSYVEGAIDLLCTSPESKHALVVDYKTGDANLTLEEIRARHEMQARFYAHVLMQQGFEAVECAFVCVELDDGTSQPVVVRYAFDSGNPPQFD